MKNIFKLLNIKKLTIDVYLLEFNSKDNFDFSPWQFITFLLPKTWLARAYSVYYKKNNNYFFLIKKLENWRGWSKEICELNIWDEILWTKCLWNFILKNTSNSKLFIWTWTWIVPLYAMSRDFVINNIGWKILLLNWNRTKDDLYELDSLENLKNLNSNFDYKIFLSREKSQFENWYVTDFLTKENISKFSEFYICWSPVMVESACWILEKYWVEKSCIFTEKY